MTAPLTPDECETLIAEAVRLTRHDQLAVGDIVMVSPAISPTICRIVALHRKVGLATLRSRFTSIETIRVPITSIAYECAIHLVASRAKLVGISPLLPTPQERPIPMSNSEIDYRTATPFNAEEAFSPRAASPETAARIIILGNNCERLAYDMQTAIPPCYELTKAFESLRTGFLWAKEALEKTDPGASASAAAPPRRNDARDPA